MQEGIKKKVQFSRMTSPDLILKPTYKHQDDDCNCSTAALSMLTNLTVPFIQSQCKSRSKEYWYIEDVIKFLEKRKFKVTELTKRTVTNRFWLDKSITSNHCLLLFLKMDAQENSALIMHKDKIWHNFSLVKSDKLYFINHPMEHVYIIEHSRWKPYLLKRNEEMRARLEKFMKRVA